MPGVYISYPFCNQKCSFCNFASGVGTGDSQGRYTAALLHEVGAHQWTWLPETLYLGGGTPSLMPIEQLTNLLRLIPRERLMEVTVECAPGTLSEASVRAWMKAGVNRVSLGVQSFDPTELRHTGRRHRAETVREDVALLRRIGLTNINIDLIAGLPHQTPQSWNASLAHLEQLEVPHSSVYIFEIDEDSRLGKEILLGGQRYSTGFMPSEETAAQFYEEGVARLRDMGLQRYEISNFARPGFQSRHNLKYWKREPYVGFGLDAHSFDGTVRWSNPDSLEAYLAVSLENREVEPACAEEEHFFVGLRLTEGIQPTADEWRQFARPIAKWKEAGMLQHEGSTLRLSDAGVLVSNEIFQEFLLV